MTEHYLNDFNQWLKRKIRGLSRVVAVIFRHYSWPGNVRELRNVIERVMILEDGDLITTTWLPRGITPEVPSETQTREAIKASAANDQILEATSASLAGLFHLPPEGGQLESVEMYLVEQAMDRSGGNQTRAAELLGISRDQLRYRLKKLEGNGH